MGISLLKGIQLINLPSTKNQHHPIVAGLILTAGNPYFLIWWATIGVTLILRSVKFGFIGFLIFAMLHWFCDFIWYTFLLEAADSSEPDFRKSFSLYAEFHYYSSVSNLYTMLLKYILFRPLFLINPSPKSFRIKFNLSFGCSNLIFT
jgi:hypothetical protein